MKAGIIAGALLIVLGVAALVFKGIPYSQKKASFRIGSVEAEARQQREIAIPGVVGIVSLAGGIILLVISLKKPQKLHE